MTKTMLVIGATGGIGGAVARVMSSRGWTVRGLTRDVEAAQRRWRGPAITWVEGDAMQAADVVAATAGADVIFHGANPPGYRNWAGLAMPMLESTITAAEAHGARIVFPGTVYNYGPDAMPLVAETAAQKPLTRKGRIRVAMEERLAKAASGGVPVIILRAGDFFGPSVGNSWFGQGIVKPGKPVTAITYPGTPDIGHAFAYLPDLAETFARLIERADELPTFAPFHFRGHFFDRGIGIAEAVRSVVGKPELRIGRFPWWMIYAGAPFVEMFREILEMRYLWKERLELDNSKLTAFLGAEPHTPTPIAIRATLEGLGCLAEEASKTQPVAALR
ncbi:NAD-dependent epimerase/dehydratase family protein [Mesorhizobium sp. BR1-1-16]|uniref:NAD-dependent epimerase/dehydratase family protein n=1 Tax=Mesorhizobium sp. BR1-1-16 TaxID=2876653 RepID=UPI001CCEDF00|nr:NAD-dependent epimerase/dehydratase family protein [Mesorhizobium sp. BR1-1-16]MBZ9936591.1 NAD-dependent epimerase/dehydratase family protein [Mesorhizobium sp. BR1-1-16]